MAHAASCGLRPVFGSNGTLITQDVARKLKAAGACAMGISIDSLDAEKHDKFRGINGAHAATLAGIEACKSVGLPFQLHTTVVDWNRDEVCDITRFAKESGAMNHSVFFLVPVGRGKDISDESIDVEQNEQLLADILRAGCDAGIEVKPTCAPQFYAYCRADRCSNTLYARLLGGADVLRSRERRHRARVRIHDRRCRRRAQTAV